MTIGNREEWRSKAGQSGQWDFDDHIMFVFR